MSSLNILFLSGQYPPHTKGGGEISTHLIAQGLVKLGHSVAVITEGGRKEETQLDGVRVLRLPIPLTKKVLFERRASRAMAKQLQPEIEKLTKGGEDKRVIHAHDWRSALVLHELNPFLHLVGVEMVVTARDYAQIAGDTNHILGDGTIPVDPFTLKNILRSHRIAEAKGLRKIMRAAQYLVNINYRRQAFASIPKQIFISYAQQKEINKHQPQGRKLIGLHAGSAPHFLWKRWPLENFAAVAKELIEKQNVHILLFGGPDEEKQKQELKKMIEELLKANSYKLKAVSIISAKLLTTAAVMQHCTLILSNDSGLMHLAAASGVKVYGLFGPTDEKKTGPRGKDSVVIRAPGTLSIYNTEQNYNLGREPHSSMLSIKPGMVMHAISNE